MSKTKTIGIDGCVECGSHNLDFRSNYEWGEEHDPDREDNVVQCEDCGHEEEDIYVD